jgi:Zn-dependent protease with chaperone function
MSESQFESAPVVANPIRVFPWPTESAWMAITAVTAGVMWVILAMSVIGLIYVAMFAVFFGLMHLVLVSHIRGSAVKLGPNQLPELHDAVTRLAARMELSPVPEAYLMQAGGALNAFATRFVRSNIIVLYSDLVEACGDNTAARDMIIAHELGHIKCGHVRWRWALLPAGIIPFIPAALSRAREYTCDRYGLAGAGDRDGAALGLAILAAGAKHGPRINRAELVRQQLALGGSALMTMGTWLGSHPPLSARIAQIDPSLSVGVNPSKIGARVLSFAAALAVLLVIVLISGPIRSFSRKFKHMRDSMAAVQRTGATNSADADTEETYVAPPDAGMRARSGVMRLATFIEGERARGDLPWNSTDLYARLRARVGSDSLPDDPYDGYWYGYFVQGRDFVVYSTGPDQRSWTNDDIRYDSRVRRILMPTGPGHTLK